MSKRPRQGRPVAFATITPERPQPDPVLGLKFTIEARHGGTVPVDMTALDPRPLSIAFAGALRRSAALGGSIGAASVIKQRSEEHTSELQSLMHISYAVFSLKKKTTISKKNHNN